MGLSSRRKGSVDARWSWATGGGILAAIAVATKRTAAGRMIYNSKSAMLSSIEDQVYVYIGKA